MNSQMSRKNSDQGMGKRILLNLLENTNMSKVYKMPVLMAFYNHGNVRMEVSEVELLASWKKFFSTGTNWKDLEKEITYEEYRKISDKNHIQKIMKMPVRFLLKSGEEFFVKKDGAALALRDEMEEIVKEPVLAEQMKDVIEYRAMSIIGDGSKEADKSTFIVMEKMRMESENYVYKKEIDWSTLMEGFTLPLDNQVIFLRNMENFLQRGQSKIIHFFMNGKTYDAKIVNMNNSVEKKKKDAYQIRYPRNGELSQAHSAILFQKHELQ